ncbi:Hsp70 family protein [Rhodococcus antarcticus]|uniref:Hsp70 family protein n=1 Tax=Rhodococcus antarcticus TaxID=2987751 RepID=A0ABY6P0K7_9NOCA|nr:Hsp70 family protein [Rhodococcus antarcticus]UZJ25009.1 Hsp70 family protein [Rhodococcus antarcticus]
MNGVVAVGVLYGVDLVSGATGAALRDLETTGGQPLTLVDRFDRAAGIRPDDYADVLERVGDPVPLRGAVLAHVQLAELLGSGVAPGDAVVVAHPDSWSRYSSEVVGEELGGRLAGPFQLVPASDAVAAWVADRRPAPPRSSDGQPTGTSLLVVAIGQRTSVVTLRRSGPAAPSDPSPNPAPLLTVSSRTGEVLTADEVGHALLRHVLQGVPALDPAALRSPAAIAALNRVRADCALAVQDLAVDTEAAVPVDLDGTSTCVRVIRAELELLLAPAVRAVADDAAGLLEMAGVSAAELDHIVVTGVLPAALVAEQLSAALGVPVRSEPSPGLAVAGGAALLAGALVPTVVPLEPTLLDVYTAAVEPPRPVFAPPAVRTTPDRRRDRVLTRVLVAMVAVIAVSLGSYQLAGRSDSPITTRFGTAGASTTEPAGTSSTAETSRSGAVATEQPGTTTEVASTMPPGVRSSGTTPGTTSGTGPGTTPDTESGTTPGTKSGTTPGTKSGTTPGTTPGTASTKGRPASTGAAPSQARDEPPAPGTPAAPASEGTASGAGAGGTGPTTRNEAAGSAGAGAGGASGGSGGSGAPTVPAAGTEPAPPADTVAPAAPAASAPGNGTVTSSTP